MTKLLEKAFAEASRLSDDEQNRLAQQVISEIESDHQWDGLFAGSQDELGRLSAETLENHRQGKTQELDLDQL